MRKLIFLAVLAMAAMPVSGAMAGGPFWHHFSAGYSYTDEADNSKLDLGIDIRRVGSTPAEVSSFVNSLPRQTQNEVWGGCRTFLAYPGNVQADVLGFCRLLVY